MVCFIKCNGVTYLSKTIKKIKMPPKCGEENIGSLIAEINNLNDNCAILLFRPHDRIILVEFKI